MNNQPSNKDSPELRAEKEKALRKAFMKYLSSLGDFADFKENQSDWEKTFVGDVILPFKFRSSPVTILAGEVSFGGLGSFHREPRAFRAR
jgi:hypothetical protein